MCVVIYVCILLFSSVNVLGYTDLYNRHRDLYNYLFVENYTSAIRSKCEHKPLNVTIDVALREIAGVYEKWEIVQLKIWVRIRWNDCKFIWNPLDFANISTMVFPYDKIWIPDITLFESIDDTADMPDKKEYNAVVKNNGSVIYRFPTAIHSTCGMDVSIFPYDKQKCTLSFGSWSHNTDDIDVFQLHDHGDLSAFLNHHEWIVVSMSAKKDTLVYGGHESFSKVVYCLTIERKPTFYIITVIFPFFLITILSLAGFVLPSVSGEKITFHMTILLAVSVFLLLIQEKLPASSESFPKIGIYFAITLIMACLACILSAIVLYIFYNDLNGKRMPQWVRIIFLDHLGKLLYVKNRRFMKEKIDECRGERKASRTSKVRLRDIHSYRAETAFQDTENVDCDDFPENGTANLRKKEEKLYGLGNFTNDSESSGRLMTDWELLAFTIDRFFTIFYVVLIVINNVVFVITLSLNENM